MNSFHVFVVFRIEFTFLGEALLSFFFGFCLRQVRKQYILKCILFHNELAGVAHLIRPSTRYIQMQMEKIFSRRAVGMCEEVEQDNSLFT